MRGMSLKKLKVDLDEITLAMDDQDRSFHEHYLDLETGETVLIPGEVMDAAEEEESAEEKEAAESLPEWEQELLALAKEIVSGNPRFREIPPRPSHEAYDQMVAFVRSLGDRLLQAKLEAALQGKGAFRRFKNELAGYPEVQEAWFKFKDAGEKEAARDWLRSIGIEPE